MQETRKPSVLSYILFTAILLAILTAAAEFALSSYLKIPSNFVGKTIGHYPELSPSKRVRPNLNDSYTGAYREYHFHVTSTPEGFRRTAPYALNDNSKPDIVTLGDSQTFGIGMDDNETIASYLSAKLNKPVLNAGCSGYNNIEEYLMAKDLLKSRSPQYFVLFFYPGNDPYENYSNRNLLTGKRDERNVSQKSGDKSFIAGTKEYLIKKSSLYALFTGVRQIPAINKVLYKMGLLNNAKPNELNVYERNPSELTKAYWAVTEEALLLSRATVTAAGSRLLVVMVPDKIQVNEPYWKLWMQKYNLTDSEMDIQAPNKRLKEFAALHQIEFLDPTPEFKKKQAEGAKLYWKLDHHLRSDGNRVLAEAAAAYIQKNPASDKLSPAVTAV